MKQTVQTWFGALLVVLFGSLASNAQAAIIVVDFNAAATGSFLSADLVEDGVTMSLVSGHYDIVPLGGDNYVNIDDATFGPSGVSFSLGGAPFTLVSIDFLFSGELGTVTGSGRHDRSGRRRGNGELQLVGNHVVPSGARGVVPGIR